MGQSQDKTYLKIVRERNSVVMLTARSLHIHLLNLKILESDCLEMPESWCFEILGLGLLRNLVVLILDTIPTFLYSSFIDEVGCLTRLQHLELTCYTFHVDKMPEYLSTLISLRKEFWWRHISKLKLKDDQLTASWTTLLPVVAQVRWCWEVGSLGGTSFSAVYEPWNVAQFAKAHMIANFEY